MAAESSHPCRISSVVLVVFGRLDVVALLKTNAAFFEQETRIADNDNKQQLIFRFSLALLALLPAICAIR